jgi:hypothetical protein
LIENGDANRAKKESQLKHSTSKVFFFCYDFDGFWQACFVYVFGCWQKSGPKTKTSNEEASNFQPNDPTFKKKGKQRSLQSQIAKQIAPQIIDTTLAKSVALRLHKFIAPLAFPNNSLEDMLSKTIKATKRLPPSVGLALFKAWCNGWVTDTRTGGCNSPCRFGCPEEDPNNRDRPAHYIDCTILWSHIHNKLRTLTKIELPQDRFSSLALIPHWHPSNLPIHLKAKAVCLTIATDIYQTVSAHQRQQQQRTTQPSNDNITRFGSFTQYVDEAFRKLNRVLPINTTSSDWRFPLSSSTSSSIASVDSSRPASSTIANPSNPINVQLHSGGQLNINTHRASSHAKLVNESRHPPRKTQQSFSEKRRDPTCKSGHPLEAVSTTEMQDPNKEAPTKTTKDKDKSPSNSRCQIPSNVNCPMCSTMFSTFDTLYICRPCNFSACPRCAHRHCAF